MLVQHESSTPHFDGKIDWNRYTKQSLTYVQSRIPKTSRLAHIILTGILSWKTRAKLLQDSWSLSYPSNQLQTHHMSDTHNTAVVAQYYRTQSWVWPLELPEHPIINLPPLRTTVILPYHASSGACSRAGLRQYRWKPRSQSSQNSSLSWIELLIYCFF